MICYSTSRLLGITNYDMFKHIVPYRRSIRIDQMSYAGEHIIAALKAAREELNLSQRAMSAKTGVPQSHISKIENGAVDIQLSSLIELARVLGLELTLVPRRL